MSDTAQRLAAALAERYRIDRELGAGGMATVYLAEDLKHHRPVALKVLRPEIAQALGPERFLREITLTAGLDHPHILPLLDSGEANGFLYYSMPYVAGESLRDRLNREKQLPLDDALQITCEVADALGYAHGRGVVHRDIKPENILLAGGHARVADFGIATALTAAGGDRLTDTGIAVGTPAYMSPEQGAGSREVDGRTDVYSLGCVLYEMLAGRPPFVGPTSESVVHQHLASDPPAVTSIRPAVPAAVAAALGRALAKTSADRFRTAREFATALQSAARSASAASTAAPRRGPRRLVVATVSVGLAVSAGAVAWLLWPRHDGSTLDPNLVAVMPFRATRAPAQLQTLALQMPDIFWMQLTGEFGPRATDPATVIRSWEQAGGTLDAGLPAEAELRIAQRQGAGRLVRGAIAATGDGLAISASLVEVPSGAVRVTPTTVRGHVDTWTRAMDSLITLLLAKDAGEIVDRIPQLARFSSEAVQAYLAAGVELRRGDFAVAGRLLDRALAADSTFVLAALQKYVAGEADLAAARFTWERLAQLSPRERAFFRAIAAWRFGGRRTATEGTAAWDSVTRSWPELGEAWYELAEQLVVFGAVTGEPRWRERARAALDRAEQLQPEGAPDFSVERRRYQLVMTAPVPDTSAMRRETGRYLSALRRLKPSGQFDHLQWRLALRLGDSIAARRWFLPALDRSTARMDVWDPVVWFAMEDGVGITDADRAADLTDSRDLSMWWARARGRHAEWLRWRDGPDTPADRVTGAVFRVRDALFLGEPEDSSVRAAARFLAAIGSRPAPASASYAGPYVEGINSSSIRDYVAARCWSTLWDLRHGKTHDAALTARYLRTEVSVPYPNKFPVCAGLIDVLLAQVEGGDLRAAVLSWDLIVRPGPIPVALREDRTHGLDNLLLARLLMQVGETAGALAAARRRFPVSESWHSSMVATLLVDFLREEGRLAAMTGDTAGAIRAYNHYLALRDEPDYEPWRIERDQVRQELATLLRERSR